MTQRVFVKLEKCLVCDLRPGELFILPPPDPQYFERELNRAMVSLPVDIRTNVPTRNSDTVYRVHINIIDREKPLPPRVDPHKPPGAKDER